jgi:hypothetical protein
LHIAMLLNLSDINLNIEKIEMKFIM